jgi:hypothetical protein
MNVNYPPVVPGNDDGPRVVLGLKLLCGFIGASLLGAGTLQLLSGEATPLSVALAAAGGVLAILNWRLAGSDFEITGATPIAPAKAPIPALPRTVIAH